MQTISNFMQSSSTQKLMKKFLCAQNNENSKNLSFK